jgi:hypothetical protein
VEEGMTEIKEDGGKGEGRKGRMEERENGGKGDNL